MGSDQSNNISISIQTLPYYVCDMKVCDLRRTTYFLALFPAPLSRNPLAKGLWSIFSCVIYNRYCCYSLVLALTLRDVIETNSQTIPP